MIDYDVLRDEPLGMHMFSSCVTSRIWGWREKKKRDTMTLEYSEEAFGGIGYFVLPSPSAFGLGAEEEGFFWYIMMKWYLRCKIN